MPRLAGALLLLASLGCFCGGSPEPTTSSGSSTSAARSNAACARFAACGLQSYEECMSQLGSASAELQACIAVSSCGALSQNKTDCAGSAPAVAGGTNCRAIACTEGPEGDRLCHARGCAGACFWGGCNSF